MSESDFGTELDMESEKVAASRFDNVDYYKVTDFSAVGLNMAFIVSKKIIIKEWKKRRAEKQRSMDG